MAEAFIGEIGIFAFTYPPQNWADCNGQLLDISSHTALFSLLGTTYGGDGRTNFALPDLRGRVPIHTGQGSGLSNYPLGTPGGVERVTLATAQLPAHNHAATAHATSAVADQRSPQNNIWATEAAGTTATYHSGAPNEVMDPQCVTTENTGNGQPHENRQPYLAVRFCICLNGIYPPRS